MKTLSLPLAVVVAGGLIGLVGCVPYQTYDSLKNEYGRAKKINEDLTANYNRLLQELAGLKGTGDFGSATIGNLQDRLRLAQEANKELARQVKDLQTTRVPEVPGFDEQIVREAGLEGSFEKGTLVLDEAILFNSGEADLKNPANNDTLNKVAKVLGRYPGEFFHIVGHTDNTPLVKTKGRWETNLNLGAARAYTVFKYFNTAHRVPESQFVIHSYGFLKPTDSAHKDTKEGRAKNRRVEIYRGGTDL